MATQTKCSVLSIAKNIFKFYVHYLIRFSNNQPVALTSVMKWTIYLFFYAHIDKVCKKAKQRSALILSVLNQNILLYWFEHLLLMLDLIWTMLVSMCTI